MRRFQRFLLVFTLAVAMAILQACGSGANTTTTTTTTVSAAKRAFIANQFAGVVDIVDSKNDLATAGVISIGASPVSFFLLSAQKKTLVYSTDNSVSLIDNTNETDLGVVNSFPAATGSIVITPDGLFAYAALPSRASVAKMDLTTQAVTELPPSPALLPGARHIAITHNGNTIVAFSDNNDTVTFIDRTNSDAVSAPLAGFDRPFTALFSSDDSTAYVLNCGHECGGTAASIAVINMATKAITLTVPVRAATVGLKDSTNLYVAGTDSTNTGQLDAMNLTSFAVTHITNTTNHISDGTHTIMAMGANNKLYIGAKACSTSGGQCLSVFNTSSGSASVLAGNSTYPAIGDVTAITPIAGRSVVYIIQNGTMVMYDSSTDAPQTAQIFISGKVVDVKEVDN